MNTERRFVFGPVLSRRLGRSLGIDPVPLKTCTYDCVYCQLGRTPSKTAEIKPWVEPGPIIDELKEVLGEVSADYITISGSGEPTLNQNIGALILAIKDITDIPVCVITNGSLLQNKKVRESLTPADLVIPSLDAGDSETFRKINRPHDSVSFDAMAEGIEKFSREFKGKIWLEVMLVENINSSEEDIEKLIPLIRKINPEKIQINTIARPPAYKNIKAISPDKLLRVKELLGEKAQIIAPGNSDISGISGPPDKIIEIIMRRPSTARDAAAYAGININEALKHLTKLVGEKSLEAETVGEEVYYKPAKKKGGSA